MLKSKITAGSEETLDSAFKLEDKLLRMQSPLRKAFSALRSKETRASMESQMLETKSALIEKLKQIAQDREMSLKYLEKELNDQRMEKLERIYFKGIGAEVFQSLGLENIREVVSGINAAGESSTGVVTGPDEISRMQAAMSLGFTTVLGGFMLADIKRTPENAIKAKGIIFKEIAYLLSEEVPAQGSKPSASPAFLRT
jgi:predicted RNase H-like nuclease (RuvC/YqgF family)